MKNTYGGNLRENLVQLAAARLVGDLDKALKESGYVIVSQLADEFIIEKGATPMRKFCLGDKVDVTECFDRHDTTGNLTRRGLPETILRCKFVRYSRMNDESIQGKAVATIETPTGVIIYVPISTLKLSVTEEDTILARKGNQKMKDLQTPRANLQGISSTEAAVHMECAYHQLRYAAWPQEVTIDGQAAVITAEAWVYAPEGNSTPGAMPALIFRNGEVIGTVSEVESAALLFVDGCGTLSQSPLLEPEIARA